MSGVLAVAPLLVVFYFSAQFINRGIDSWFHVEIGSGLSNALNLSRAALDLRSREYLDRTQKIARRLSLVLRNQLQELDSMRQEFGASEVSIVTLSGRGIAISSSSLGNVVPTSLSEEMLLQVKQGRPYVGLDPLGAGEYQVRTAVPMLPPVSSEELRVLQATYPLEQRLGQLADVVEESSKQYAELQRAREPLKTSFTLTLALVLLMSVFGALYGAFWVARRLVKPIENLVAGTRAVARGDFDTRLPLTSHDEMGVLVHSFNDMTKRLARARLETLQSQQAMEAERANLAVILARLSTGVIALEPDLKVRTANEAAGTILGIDLQNALGKPLIALAGEASLELPGTSLAAQFVAACQVHLKAGDNEWREQLGLRSESGRRVLVCACTALPGEDQQAGGYVIVFDDITALLQAQRDAAWGEVARRLAHEIKNPLTPIRLSAERLHHKLLPSMNDADAQILERATFTIVQQVDAMKDMVNAFSQYARAPEMELSRFSLNELIAEITELYRAQDPLLRLRTQLDPNLGEIEADRGRVRQVLHNLIKNSMEALEGRSRGEIFVHTALLQRGSAPTVEIVVEDDGPGFQPDFFGRMFDPYVTSKLKGTGLGLAIVKKIVEEHGGHIEAENRPEGGAIVRVELPLVAAERNAGRETRRETWRERT